MKTISIRPPGAPSEVPPLPADLIQPMVDESLVTYFLPTPPPFYFLHSSHLPAGTTTPFHRHPCLALHGCLQGPLGFVSGGQEHLLEAGTFFLVGPGVLHGWQNRGPHTAANFSLLIDQRRPGSWPAKSGVEECVRELAKRGGGLHRFQAGGDPELKHIFWTIADRLMADRKGGRAGTTGLLLTLLARLSERLGEPASGPAEKSDTAEEIRRYLLARIGDPLSIDDVTAALCLSPTQAKRAFREKYGCGIMAYFSQMKVWQAKRLLTATSQTVEQIARRLGFSTASYFSRAFLRSTGQTPSEFRNQVREG